MSDAGPCHNLPSLPIPQFSNSESGTGTRL